MAKRDRVDAPIKLASYAKSSDLLYAFLTIQYAHPMKIHLL